MAGGGGGDSDFSRDANFLRFGTIFWVGDRWDGINSDFYVPGMDGLIFGSYRKIEVW